MIWNGLQPLETRSLLKGIMRSVSCIYPLKAAMMGCFYTDMFLPQFKYPLGGSLVQCNRRPTDEFTWIPADSIEFLLPAQMENNPLDDLTSKSFTNS